MRSRMVIVRSRMGMQVGGHARRCGGTEFQGEWHAGRRHEAGRHIGTKQEQGQQQDAGP
jgi:hypothetical protein